MADNEKNLPPRIYHLNDPDQVVNLWKDMLGTFMDSERIYATDFQKILDPDQAPADFIDLMLEHLGNPFTRVNLNLTQKRKLAKFLVPIYRQKGTAAGIINAVRFLTGIELTIEDPHGDPEGIQWEVGISEVGYSTYVGGDSAKCNLLNWSEEFSQISAWTPLSMAVIADNTPGPSPFGGLADRLNLSAVGASYIEQSVATVLPLVGETFTGSVWLKSSVPSTIQTILGCSPSETIQSHSVTTSWQRFTFQHTIPGGTSPPLILGIGYLSAYLATVWAFGAQLVRGNSIQPYYPTTTDGADCSHPGPWIYHFIIRSPVALTDELEAIIRMVADFIKPAHTHYTLLDVTAPDAIDHWEVGQSQVGTQTFVHA